MAHTHIIITFSVCYTAKMNEKPNFVAKSNIVMNNNNNNKMEIKKKFRLENLKKEKTLALLRLNIK